MQIHPETESKLRLLLKAFLEENANINLSALRTEDACWTGNILDSLAFDDLKIAETMRRPRATLMDVGTGGGFPLLPLAVLYPQADCTGLDSIRKKIDAIVRIVVKAGIKIAGVAQRAEVLGHAKNYRGQFDVVTSRAVATLNTLLEYCSPFAKVGGYIVLWKSMHIDEELKASANAQKILHCELIETHQYDLGGDWGVRQLLVFKKTGPTPANYPREVGAAKREPL